MRPISDTLEDLPARPDDTSPTMIPGFQELAELEEEFMAALADVRKESNAEGSPGAPAPAGTEQDRNGQPPTLDKPQSTSNLPLAEQGRPAHRSVAEIASLSTPEAPAGPLRPRYSLAPPGGASSGPSEGIVLPRPDETILPEDTPDSRLPSTPERAFLFGALFMLTCVAGIYFLTMITGGS